MGYRCRTCRRYYRDDPYQRLSLGAVCSETCLDTLKRTHKSRRSTSTDIPPDVRAVVLERDRCRCRYCGTTFELHLHHVRYRSEGVNHNADNLITLCRLHHALIHSNKRHWQPLCLAYIDGAQRGQLAFLIDLERLSGSEQTMTARRRPTSDPKR